MHARGSASAGTRGRLVQGRWLFAGSHHCAGTKSCTSWMSRASHQTSDVAGDARESLKCLERNIARKAAMIPKESLTGVKRVMDGRS